MITVSELTSVTEDAIRELDVLAKELRGEAGNETPATKEDVERIVGDPSVILMTVQDAGRIIGMGALYVHQKVGKRVAEVEDVVVSGDYRGQGLGEKLMRAILEKARANGIRSVSLTSRPSRVAAHKLYEKLGFEKRETDVFRLKL
ncbi:MAG: GNAT family N-acetyltransferase [Patescibacteria group bacterium]|nr:GNAT family N-acetyltransferase [Patescibacteria group bacterium]MDE1966101.1 GNAT family N-acetyltransferase [Patescibacteria group bacterium]